MDELVFTRPDDWHLHLRDGALLEAVLPHTAAWFGRAVVMPNLKPPVSDTDRARAYRDEIRALLPAESRFEPLMAAYLTEDGDPADIVAGHREGVIFGVKYYPAHATTHSAAGVRAIENVYRHLEAFEEAQVPVLFHGEVTDPDIDIFDREAVFIERILEPLRARFPGLKVVLEHLTTRDGVEFVKSQHGAVGATITCHHLMHDRNAMFQGGLRPHLYCLPILKARPHTEALRAAATSGLGMFFLGTDSAPHLKHAKETDCGCAGVFNAPVALSTYAEVFEEEGALDRFEAFASLNGPRFYGLRPNSDRIRLRRAETTPPSQVNVPGEGQIVVFEGDRAHRWVPEPASP